MKKKPLNQDDLVEALVPDPNTVENYQMLYGWPGKSGRVGYLRLYDNLELKGYKEFPEDKVHLIRSMKTPENPLGGSMVWLPRGTTILSVGWKTDQRSEMDFLRGEFQSSLQNYEDDSIGEQTGYFKRNFHGLSLLPMPINSIRYCKPRSSIFDCPIVVSTNFCG